MSCAMITSLTQHAAPSAPSRKYLICWDLAQTIAHETFLFGLQAFLNMFTLLMVWVPCSPTQIAPTCPPSWATRSGASRELPGAERAPRPTGLGVPLRAPHNLAYGPGVDPTASEHRCVINVFFFLVLLFDCYAGKVSV